MNVVRYDQRQASRSRRHGMSTLYALVYVTLATGVMAATGQLLHSVMRASDVDRRLFHELQMTQLVAARVRDDTSSAVFAALPDTQHLDLQNDAGTITWSVNDHMLTRLRHEEQKLKSRSHFRFRHGTQLQFDQENEQLGRLRITFPPLAWLPSAPAASTAGDGYIDIVIPTHKLGD